MDDEIIWKMRVRQVESSIRELCQTAIAEGRLDRLRDFNLALHDIERDILDHFQVHERGEKAIRPVPRLLRPLMRGFQDFFCYMGFDWEWQASKIRTRLGGSRFDREGHGDG